MAVYKEADTGTWRVIYRYTDWMGERKQTSKRGFLTKRKALAWEREQLNWEAYERSLAIMGPTRNSYAKTDPDATFMRMKEDHMRNGQLKPAYNVHLAVNSEYITGLEVFSNRTDFGTLKPFLRRLEQLQSARNKEIVADAGYESLDNYLYKEATGQTCFIKPANHEQIKTRKFKKQIGRIENMVYNAVEDCFTCAEGHRLSLRRELVLSKSFWEKRAQAEENICSGRGIHLRLCRSIQVEAAFGLIKNDFAFRRFLSRGKENVRTELFLLALAFNLEKLWMKRERTDYRPIAPRK